MNKVLSAFKYQAQRFFFWGDSQKNSPIWSTSGEDHIRDQLITERIVYGLITVALIANMAFQLVPAPGVVLLSVLGVFVFSAALRLQKLKKNLKEQLSFDHLFYG